MNRESSGTCSLCYNQEGCAGLKIPSCFNSIRFTCGAWGQYPGLSGCPFCPPLLLTSVCLSNALQNIDFPAQILGKPQAACDHLRGEACRRPNHKSLRGKLIHLNVRVSQCSRQGPAPAVWIPASEAGGADPGPCTLMSAEDSLGHPEALKYTWPRPPLRNPSGLLAASFTVGYLHPPLSCTRPSCRERGWHVNREDT